MNLVRKMITHNSENNPLVGTWKKGFCKYRSSTYAREKSLTSTDSLGGKRIKTHSLNFQQQGLLPAFPDPHTSLPYCIVSIGSLLKNGFSCCCWLYINVSVGLLLFTCVSWNDINSDPQHHNCLKFQPLALSTMVIVLLVLVDLDNGIFCPCMLNILRH